MKFSLCSFVLTLAAASSVFAGSPPNRAMLESKMTELGSQGYACTELRGGKFENRAFNSVLSCQKSDGNSKLFMVRYENQGPEGARCSYFSVTKIEEI